MQKLVQSENGKVNLLEAVDFYIFDFDGVLYDSMPRICLAALHLIKDLGTPELVAGVRVEDICNTYDAPFFDFYRTYGIEINSDDDKKKIADYYHTVSKPKANIELSTADSIFPDVVPSITHLHAQGKKVGIISAGNEADIKEILLRCGIQDCFDFVSGSNHIKEYAIAAHVSAGSIDPVRTAYFGDLPSDIRHALGSNSGIRAVGVARTPMSARRLEEAGADYIISGLSLDALAHAQKIIV